RCSGSFNIGQNSWRSYVDYSGGGLTDWGAHHFGGATFCVDVRDFQPTEVVYHDDSPGIWLTFKYANGMEISNNRPRTENMASDSDRDTHVEAKPVPGYKGNGIYGDFIECVKTREKPFRDIQYGINTVSLAHLAYITYELKRSLKWDPEKVEFP